MCVGAYHYLLYFCEPENYFTYFSEKAFILDLHVWGTIIIPKLGKTVSENYVIWILDRISFDCWFVLIKMLM